MGKMDFYRILEVETKDRNTKKDVVEVFPDFQVCRSKDLMIRGKKFYAIWDEMNSLWSTDEYDVQRLVDDTLREYAKTVDARTGANNVRLKTLGNFSTGLWSKFQQYTTNLSDNAHQLDERVTYQNTQVRKEDYASKRLPYALSDGTRDAYDEIVATLFDPSERAKLEWAVGAILSGDAREIQKFIVLYGPAGAGKSTYIKFFEWLFDGYTTTFEAKALTSSSNAFSTEVFRHNPLVAIQHDGDLSRIEDNTKLNSIVSHEDMTMNEKFKASYTAKIHAFLVMGSNKAVKITDAKSGLIRRLIDVQPSGRKLPERRYHMLMFQAKLELGAIAQHCLDVYREMGRDYYSSYKPVEMMLQTDVFFNFIEHFYDVFEENDGVSLSHAYTLYKQYCADALVEYKLPLHRFRDELRNYFHDFHDRYEIRGERYRSYYTGFITEHFEMTKVEEKPMALILDKTESLLDEVLRDAPAQYSKADGSPTKFWSDKERMIKGELRVPDPNMVCSTILSDLDTTKEHYTKPDLNHIVIDFDLKDENGEKSKELNLEAASKWPPTYAEYSKGGAGIHLHYYYEGDPTELSRIYGDHIEIKVFVGDSSLRRRLSYCNDVPIATISSGLPLKEKKMLNGATIQSEKSLRAQIARNLRKEVHHSTKPSMDFIKHILDEAYDSGMIYNVTDMQQAILTFAMKSTNQSLYCLKLIPQMKLVGKVPEDVVELAPDGNVDELVVFDCEVFPNLFIVNWKYYGVPGSMTRLINPTPEEIEALTKLKLVGFNNRRYDNHILYARIMGYSEYELYQLSQKLINGDRGATFGAAYGLSYADIFDFAATKMSLKKWQIKLGLKHQENEFPWDKPVPEKDWPVVSGYCDNDVESTEEVLTHLWSDFQARKMMAEMSGLAVNEPLQKHAAKIILGDKARTANTEDFLYTDLATGERFTGTKTKMTSMGFPVNTAPNVTFAGYEFELGKSTYRDVTGENNEYVGEGGYVYAEPGMYENVVVLDVESMHPASIVAMNAFGEHTHVFEELMQVRLAIKHGNFDKARKLFDGKLAPYLQDEDQAEALSYALKIIINSIYGLTAAAFDNPFRDPKNKDNIVAKRGALFMIDLRIYVQEELKLQVVHIKTDSIKIPGASDEVIQLITEFGARYGYKFEHEATYDRFCLVNDAVYIAHVGWAQKEKKIGTWEAVGKQFQHPYVFKKLFTKESVVPEDLGETKTVQGSTMYLDFTPDSDTPMALMPDTPASQDLHFIGRAGLFVPVSVGGGYLLRDKTTTNKEGVEETKLHAVTDTKGFKWREAESLKATDSWYDVDYTYYNKKADEAIEQINKYGDFEQFVADSFADDRVTI